MLLSLVVFAGGVVVLGYVVLELLLAVADAVRGRS
jgi:hypothetical protein